MSFKEFFKSLGPGIVTGGSDNDPSGIATYSQAGAQLGYGLLWMAIVTLPMIMIVQEMCARIGIASGKGLSQIIKQYYSKKLLYSIASLLLIANTINIGADIGAMGASLRLLIPQVPFFISTFFFLLISCAWTTFSLLHSTGCFSTCFLPLLSFSFLLIPCV